ncbi:MAG TPA: sugar-transfer associated ATP-grasp domain-containing protein [Candidatus Moranbacteria bacterium]|nr:sugar-transfer associated ATP-grasp domain-containing protein [Candidatus Moranbacteria bacterium]HRZ33485.1 sugar-transfer associated ATP-grasp domain-containing protein [Candidatus Moranbacteria bacterium]
MFDYIKNAHKLLGMNARNLEYIRQYNRKNAKRLADDKIMSKRILKKAGIPVPELIAKIKSVEELDDFNWDQLPNSFVLKPSRGFGGGGILIVYGKKKNKSDIWIKADGSTITVEDIKSHVLNILDGSFSLSNLPDVAFFEERLALLKLFKPYAYKGVPDIRVIVFNSIPVMAMLRLPTKESKGKANLQQGGIGIGIDLASGITTTAVLGKGKIIDYVPGTRLLLSGIKIPYWKEILLLAVKAQEISGMGYLGADIAIDRERGPVFLEINARPGLSIQIANLSGLRERLERVKGIKIKSAERGVRVGRDLFGGEVEEELEDISGRKVIGTIEKIKIIYKDGKEIEVDAKIDTGANSTSIDYELAKEIGFGETVDEFSKIDLSQYQILPENESEIKKDILAKYKEKITSLEDVAVIFSSSGSSIRPVIKVSFIMDDIEITSKANLVKRENLKCPVIIGKRDLKKFLIDVNK